MGQWCNLVAWLQLGRGSEAAETCSPLRCPWRVPGASIGPRLGGRGDLRDDGERVAHPRASIGPRLGGRGDRPTTVPNPGGPRRFNWAAARRPRRRHLAGDDWLGGVASIGPRLGGRGDALSTLDSDGSPAMLQLGRGSEAAETSHGRRSRQGPECASIGPRLGGRGDADKAEGMLSTCERFNWAAARRPRRRATRGGVRAVAAGFNWAAARRPRRPATDPASRTRPSRFNWAAARRPRRRRSLSHPVSLGISLQLGRGSEAAETALCGEA